MVLQDRCLTIQGTLWSYKTGVLQSREHYGLTRQVSYNPGNTMVLQDRCLIIQGTLWSYNPGNHYGLTRQVSYNPGNTMVLQDRCLTIQGTLWSYKTGVLLSREHYMVLQDRCLIIQGSLWSLSYNPGNTMALQDRCLTIQGTLWPYKTGVLQSRGPLWSYKTVASYPGPYTHAVLASFQGGIRAWYPLSYACARFSQKSVK